MADVLTIIESAEITSAAMGFAKKVFPLLAVEEGAVHGIGANEVHFHEIGALDSIADILGCAVALDSLGVFGGDTEVVCSAVAVGSGEVHAAHGRLPVPPPAVRQLMQNASVPIAEHPGTFELCTPTGGALVSELADRIGPLPSGVVQAIGIGAGTADPATHANIVRVVVVEGPTATLDQRREQLHLVEATVDDMDPRLWPGVLELLQQAGAKNSWLSPCVMRKGRTGLVVSAIAEENVLDSVANCVFVHTSTVGLRVTAHDRRSLPRDHIEIPVAGENLPVKRGFLDDRAVTVQPEFRDAVDVASRTGLTVQEVLYRGRQSARSGEQPSES